MIIKISNINFGRGYVYSIQYHIVWCVKYRRKVLIDDIKKTLKELLIEISNENNIKINIFFIKFIKICIDMNFLKYIYQIIIDNLEGSHKNANLISTIHNHLL